MGARTAPSCKPAACNDVLCGACCLRMCVQVDMSLGAATPLRAVRQLVPWHRQFKVLLARALKEQIRWGGMTGSGCRAVPWTQGIPCDLLLEEQGAPVRAIGCTLSCCCLKVLVALLSSDKRGALSTHTHTHTEI